MFGGIITIRLTSRWPWNPLSLAIGIAAGSRQFSHAMTIIEGRAYEASMTHGCRAGTVEELMNGVAVYRDMDVWVPDLDAAIAFAEAQIGKRYDWAGAIGIPFTYSGDWSDDRCWWCSDLAFAIVLAGGTKLFDPDFLKRARPIDLHMSIFPKGPILRWQGPPKQPPTQPAQAGFFSPVP